MYARYSRTQTDGFSSYRFVEECSLFGCKIGYIPKLLRKQTPVSQTEPYKWHIVIEPALNAIECQGSTLVIDLKPKQKKTNLSLYEILDIWGYSDSGWTPILLHLSGLFVDKDPASINRNEFTIPDLERDEPIYEFLHLDGSVANGKLTGRWNAPPASPTNAALLWPAVLAYFIQCIQDRTPDIVEPVPSSMLMPPPGFGTSL